MAPGWDSRSCRKSCRTTVAISLSRNLLPAVRSSGSLCRCSRPRSTLRREMAVPRRMRSFHIPRRWIELRRRTESHLCTTVCGEAIVRRSTVSLLAGVFGILLVSQVSIGQTGEAQPADSGRTESDQVTVALRDLQREVQELRAAVAEVHSEAAQYHAETLALRQELERLHAGA